MKPHQVAHRLLVFALALLAPAVRAQAPDTTVTPPIDPLALPGVVQLDPQVAVRAVYRMQHRLIWEGALEQAERTRESKRAANESKAHPRREKRGRTRAGGDSPKPSTVTPAPQVAAGIAAPFSSASVPANMRANDPTGDASTAVQAEVSLATIGTSVLMSWNDGQGFATGGPVQGVASSAGNGLSWTDRGDPPVQAGWALFRWRGDPVVTVNQKTGAVFVFGLADLDRNEPSIGTPDTSAIVMARAHFNRGVPVWDDVRVVRAQATTQWFLDKEWAAADSTTGNLYVVWTEFDKINHTDRILFMRSSDSGVSWSSPLQLSSAADAGDVQGARVAVGPAGEIHAVWYHNDPLSAFYHLRFRRSVNGGVSFEAEQTPATYVANSGTGAPGFNRVNGIDMPSLAVDRTTGQYRGRVYLGFSESYNYGDDSWPAQPPASTVIFETEPNGTAATATPFTLGQTLRGSCTSSDLDWYRYSLVAGQHVIVWLDSLPTTIANISVYAPGGVQRLGYGQGGQYSDGFFSLMYTITAAQTGTYYIQVDAGGTGSYRLRTKAGVTGSERGRDRRDVFASWSQNGTGGFASPVRVCDNAVGSDDYLPEIAVAPDGNPYLFWFDERLDPAMALTHIYMSRSNNGGGSWVVNDRISDASGSFTTCGANSYPNMGDYIGVAANTTHLIVGWGDARDTDVNVYAEGFPTTVALSTCPPDTTVPAGSTFNRWVNFQNRNPFYPDQYTYSISDNRGWVNADNAYFSLQPEAYQPLAAQFAIPTSAAQGLVDHVCVSVGNSTGASVATCCFNVTVNGVVAVEPGPAAVFALAQSVPNPALRSASIGYSLPAPGRVHLAIYDLAGARVRTLVDAPAEAGPHTVRWDARDDAGHDVAAGVYFYRLTFAGRTAERRLVLLR